MVTPIIIHFGYNDYLQYSLKVAKELNPDATIILLGDDDNKDIAARRSV